MCCQEFNSISLYVASLQSLYDKIQALEAIENAMLVSLLDSAGTATYAMYELDDGQVRVKTNYRSPKEVTEGLNAIRAAKNVYINQYNGRRTSLRAINTLKGGFGCC